MIRIVFCTLVLIANMAAPGAAEDVTFDWTELWIESATGRHHFNIEVAETEAQRQRGLMFRKEMPADAGMIFDYGATGYVAMWMKNTFIPLDMLFVNEDGTIRRIASFTTPLSLESIPSGGPVRAVIELNGGITARLGIRRGDKVIHDMFGTQ